MRRKERRRRGKGSEEEKRECGLRLGADENKTR